MTNESLPTVPPDFQGQIVLGIDPGTQVLGYGAIVDRREGPVLLAAGVLRAPRGAPVPQRLAFLSCELEELITRLRPNVVAVEEAFAGENIQSALRMGEGRGVVLAMAARSSAKIVQYPPAVAKRTLVGNGRADKQQVAQMVVRELRLAKAPQPLDVTDALAMALTFLHRRSPLETL